MIVNVVQDLKVGKSSWTIHNAAIVQLWGTCKRPEVFIDLLTKNSEQQHVADL